MQTGRSPAFMQCRDCLLEHTIGHQIAQKEFTLWCRWPGKDWVRYGSGHGGTPVCPGSPPNPVVGREIKEPGNNVPCDFSRPERFSDPDPGHIRRCGRKADRFWQVQLSVFARCRGHMPPGATEISRQTWEDVTAIRTVMDS